MALQFVEIRVLNLATRRKCKQTIFLKKCEIVNELNQIDMLLAA